jgi:hypothetical protein
MARLNRLAKGEVVMSNENETLIVEETPATGTEVANTPGTDVGTSAPAANPQTPTQSEQDKANAQWAESVMASALLLRLGFGPAKTTRTQQGHPDDVLDREIIKRLAADVAGSTLEDETLEKNVYVQGKAILSDLTTDQHIEKVVNAMAERVKAKMRALRNCNTTRVTLRGGIPCLAYGMAYIGFSGTKRDLQTTMFNAPLAERK